MDSNLITLFERILLAVHKISFVHYSTFEENVLIEAASVRYSLGLEVAVVTKLEPCAAAL